MIDEKPDRRSNRCSPRNSKQPLRPQSDRFTVQGNKTSPVPSDQPTPARQSIPAVAASSAATRGLIGAQPIGRVDRERVRSDAETESCPLRNRQMRVSRRPISLSVLPRPGVPKVPLEGTHIAGATRPLHLREYGTTVLGQVLENVRAFAAAMRGSYAAGRDETRPRTRLVDRA